jgi:hypothetical protein
MKQTHTLVLVRDALVCEVCGGQWKRTPRIPCPGVPVISWDDRSHGLLTKTQLGKAGYQTGLKLPMPCAALQKGYGWIWLYNPSEAVPKRRLSPAQMDALVKATETRYAMQTCPRCGANCHGNQYWLYGMPCKACLSEERAEVAR